MKIKNLILGLAAISALSLTTSCVQDGIVDPAPDSGVKAYMTLRLVGENMATRTVGGPTELGSAEENKITSAAILLCDILTKEVRYAYNVSDGMTATGEGVRTKPIQVSVGTFEVYVIANAGNVGINAYESVTGKTIEMVTEDLMRNAYAGANSFIMFNECNGTDDTDGALIVITEDNSYDRPATCDPIKLDRLAAKIQSRVFADDGFGISGVQDEGSFITDVTLEGFKLLNGATQVNLQQRWTNLAGSTASGSEGATWKNTLVTPWLSAGDNAGGSRYYNALAGFRTINKTVAPDGSEDYTLVKDLYEGIPAYGATPTSPIYVMENNPTWDGTQPVEAKNGNTTGLVYRFKATVPDSDGRAGENCFYGYDGKFFATLEALQAKFPGVFMANGGADAATQLANAAAELAAATDEDQISDFRAKYLVKVYKGGIMYYTHFIKDKNYEDAAGKRYYSVMRNTIYDLTVRNLLRIGTDVPGGWNPEVDPEDPVDNKNVYMVVEVKVNPWVLSIEDIDLGGTPGGGGGGELPPVLI